MSLAAPKLKPRASSEDTRTAAIAPRGHKILYAPDSNFNSRELHFREKREPERVSLVVVITFGV